MKSMNSDAVRQLEPASGPLERSTTGDNDPVEKSLLSLIEERARRQTDSHINEHERGALITRERSSDDFNESTDHAEDRMAIRLGGNGF